MKVSFLVHPAISWRLKLRMWSDPCGAGNAEEDCVRLCTELRSCARVLRQGLLNAYESSGDIMGNAKWALVLPKGS
jgi:hypothetical protein